MIYPVDTSFPYVAYSISNDTAKRIKWPRADGGEVLRLDPDIKLLVVTKGTKPPFDPDLQKLAPYHVVDGDEYRTEYNVIDLSQVEIDAIQQVKDEDAERLFVRALVQKLNDGQGTAAQRIARLERVAVRLIRDSE